MNKRATGKSLLIKQRLKQYVPKNRFFKKLILLARIVSTTSSARCGLLLQMWHVTWSICVCVCMYVKTISPAKTAEPIEMPLEMQARFGPKDRVVHIWNTIKRSVLGGDAGCR